MSKKQEPLERLFNPHMTDEEIRELLLKYIDFANVVDEHDDIRDEVGEDNVWEHYYRLYEDDAVLHYKTHLLNFISETHPKYNEYCDRFDDIFLDLFNEYCVSSAYKEQICIRELKCYPDVPLTILIKALGIEVKEQNCCPTATLKQIVEFYIKHGGKNL